MLVPCCLGGSRGTETDLEGQSANKLVNLDFGFVQRARAGPRETLVANVAPSINTVGEVESHPWKPRSADSKA